MTNKTISLTESEFRALVLESVKNVMMNEGIWGGLKNAAKAGVNLRHIPTAYELGSLKQDYAKAYKRAFKALQDLEEVSFRNGDNDMREMIGGMLTRMADIRYDIENRAKDSTDFSKGDISKAIKKGWGKFSDKVNKAVDKWQEDDLGDDNTYDGEYYE